MLYDKGKKSAEKRKKGSFGRNLKNLPKSLCLKDLTVQVPFYFFASASCFIGLNGPYLCCVSENLSA